MSEVKEAIERFTMGTNHKSYEMAILVVMGHGNGRAFNLSDGSVLESWIIDCFSSTNCVSLRAKPKMLIFNNCRCLLIANCQPPKTLVVEAQTLSLSLE